MRIEYKRQVIYTVLAKVVNEQTLLEVMWHWQNTYSNTSIFELNKFLSDFKDIAEIANKRSLLYREMVALLVSETKDILPDPWSLMIKHQNESISLESDKFEEKEDWSIVFTSIIDKLFYSLRSDTQSSMLNYIFQQLDKTELPIFLKESFYLWGKKRNVIDTKGADLEQLKKLLHLVYIALCEFVGPVKSDLFLSNAIKETCSIHKDEAVDARLLL